MEVFVSNVPKESNQSQFTVYLAKELEKLSITTFSCQKHKHKPWATIAFLHPQDGKLFLDSQNSIQLKYLSKPLRCRLSNDRVPDPLILKSLSWKEEQTGLQAKGQPPKLLGATQLQFEGYSLACGIWDYDGVKPIFVSHMDWIKPISVKFGKRNLIVTVGNSYRMHVSYYSIQSIVIQGEPQPAITFALSWSPIFFSYEACLADRSGNMFESPENTHRSNSSMRDSSPTSKLSEMVSSNCFNEAGLAGFAERLGNTFSSPENKQSQPMRVPSLGLGHNEMVSTCTVYRVRLCKNVYPSQIAGIQKERNLPLAIFQRTEISQARESYRSAFEALLNVLKRAPYVSWPFSLRFQVQKMAQDAFLPPAQVRLLLPEIARILECSGDEVAVAAVRKLVTNNQIPFAGPGTDAHELLTETLVAWLRENERRSKVEVLNNKHSDNTVMIHKAIVTPTGVYLMGPEPEANNRILRKYRDKLHYFLRVTFADEDFEPLRFNQEVSNALILKRFKNIALLEGINIVGNKYSYLGRSHSSSRSQSFWIMAPFVDHDRTFLIPSMVIAKIGDFSNIRCPAKCAARIGQAFSDTRQIVPMDPTILRQVRDVERNNRVFSDGCGTFSKTVLHRFWNALPRDKKCGTTCFQIRCLGYKGMLSYDASLEGDVVLMRDSMRKFEASAETTDIEICSSGNKPLPLYLNRQMIKILEDCGVPDSFFLKLQRKAIDELRSITMSSHNAAYFLETRSIGSVFNLPWLIRRLNALHYSFRDDDFLRDAVEMAVVVELRSIKYKSRIPVKQGVVLLGIMDESGVLEEGEVFITQSSDLDDPRKQEIITGRDIIISRSPALHPGDVQTVTARDVKALRHLSNCICFSQKGDRDLPSMLSGGDLDGDTYQIIYDPDAKVEQTYRAAEYERKKPVELDRQVTSEDMVDFFLDFMATDQLGRISVAHTIVADQEELGTRSEKCKILAEMASTAVDYSKTGIKVDTPWPKYSPVRPDFLSPNPYVLLASKEGISLDAQAVQDEQDEEWEPGPREYQYYPSEKILGKLYRDIDEPNIFSHIQQRSSDFNTKVRATKRDIMNELWNYILQLHPSTNWKQHLDLAKEIRSTYEDDILNIMYEYAVNPRHPVSELEVFIGQIVGKSGAISKRQKENSIGMKEEFDKKAEFVMNQIRRGDNGEVVEDALGRAMACFYVSIFEGGRLTKRRESLQSFKYIAGAICLREAEKAQNN